MNPQPLSLEYQSRVIRAKKLATGGLMLLGGGLALISPFAALGMFASVSGPTGISISPLLLAAVGMMCAALDGILMIVSAVLILRNHLPSVRLATWLVYFLFVSVAVLFYALLADAIHTEKDWTRFIPLLLCCLAVYGGLVAVLVELAIVRRAILQGHYLPPAPADTLRPDPRS